MRKTTVSTITTLILVLAGIALLATGCKKEGEHHPARGKDAVVRIRVQDEKGNSLGGIPILIYDETGYEKFEKNRNTPPTDRTVTQADGEIVYRLPYDKWLKKGNRFLSFVIYERLDDDNYRIWAASRTIVAGKEERIDFELEMTRREKPLLGTPLDLYDENNGRTLFAQALYLDAEHRFAGANRYSMVDVGPVSGVEELGELRLDGFTDRTDAQLRHGYFICKDVRSRSFPRGNGALQSSRIMPGHILPTGSTTAERLSAHTSATRCTSPKGTVCHSGNGYTAYRLLATARRSLTLRRFVKRVNSRQERAMNCNMKKRNPER